MSNHLHICKHCDGRYPSNGILSEVSEGEFDCDCDGPKDECKLCSPELYQPLCVQCDEDGDYALATQVIDTPWGVLQVCEKHYDAAGERGATMWSTEDVGAGEQMAAAYAVDRGQK